MGWLNIKYKDGAGQHSLPM